VDALAKGADLLVSEIMDPDETMARLKRERPDTPAEVVSAVAFHMHRQHMSPQDVGLMANRAGVKAVVLTHDALAREARPMARRQISQNFKGPVTFAEDLQVF
jgi:ribonuclease BN (tRNA processing enzyme)